MGLFKDLRDLNEQARRVSAQYPITDVVANAQAGMAQAQQLLDSLAATSSEATAGLVDGVDTTATVVGARQTGLIVSFNPVVDLDLIVVMPGGAPRPVTRREVVAQLHLARAQPGMRLRVKVDPTDVSRLWIDWNTIVPPTPPPPRAA
jgi:hypothetical protein